MSDQPVGRGRPRNFNKPGPSGDKPRVVVPTGSAEPEKIPPQVQAQVPAQVQAQAQAQVQEQVQEQVQAQVHAHLQAPIPPQVTHSSVTGFTHRGTNKPVIKSTFSTSNALDKQVNLLANYVKVRANTRIIIYQYHVDFSIKVVNPDTRTFLIQSEADLFQNAYIYDKQNTIMSTTLLRQDPCSFTQNLGNRKEAKVTVRKVREIAIDDEQMMHFFNAQLRMNMEKLDLIQILKNFYNFEHRVHVAEHKLEIIPGIVATIKNCQEGILMGLDTIHKVIHLKTCLDVINEMTASGRTYYEKELVGSIVLTRYNNRTYRICGVDRNKTPMEEFDKKGGDKTNFVEYYSQNYNITIRERKQPLLVAVSSNFEKKQKSKKLLLVPELCFITGLTPSMQTNFNLKRLLIQKTQLTPRDRVTRYNNFLNVINSNAKVQEELEKWQIGYGADLMHIPGTQLAPEKIITQEHLSFNQASADFTRELRGKTMYKSCSLSNWHIVCPARDQKTVEGFVFHVNELTRNFGIRYQQPIIINTFGDNSRGYLQAISKIEDSEMIVVVLPNNNKTLYDDIKKHLCCEIGFPSQCVLAKTLFKRNMSISTKIVIQMAVKVGAEPWILDVNVMPDDVMVVGFDVFRDKSKRRKSVGGFVASLNPTFSSWFSKINFHVKTEEMSDQFATSLGAALRAYYKRNNKYPTKIVVIRDGVSEGQYKFTIETELEQLKQRSRQTDPNCKITFMCINKRIMTRFFRSDGELDNPVSGTVVDHTIVNANIPQFFLVSQSTTQGTVSPTSYDILQDNIGWPLVEYQRLVYKLCHLYYNWTGLISVPSPCQYAHKLAYLAGGSFEKPFKDHLSEKLFFL